MTFQFRLNNDPPVELIVTNEPEYSDQDLSTPLQEQCSSSTSSLTERVITYQDGNVTSFFQMVFDTRRVCTHDSNSLHHQIIRDTPILLNTFIFEGHAIRLHNLMDYLGFLEQNETHTEEGLAQFLGQIIFLELTPIISIPGGHLVPLLFRINGLQTNDNSTVTLQASFHPLLPSHQTFHGLFTIVATLDGDLLSIAGTLNTPTPYQMELVQTKQWNDIPWQGGHSNSNSSIDSNPPPFPDDRNHTDVQKTLINLYITMKNIPFS
ncbi:hypothetical protein [Endozoicomonas numazuensis]|uniref:hypothetical protein n=1 Tax=Endozoicomonas numazuensis TaxID=1137799 RepID=UPI001F2E9F68|nr:hypothetical protein [Endozoicomonas numazuensis]